MLNPLFTFQPENFRQYNLSALEEILIDVQKALSVEGKDTRRQDSPSRTL